jgi:NAD(P)H dehydrogenase (quinone)
MKVLWVFAHPERRSLNGALKDEGLATLDALGHQHRVSDLYAMGWKATVDVGDFPAQEPDERLVVPRSSQRAHRQGTLSADIVGEQEKLRWADTVVLQFPLWWYGMPAILKGWFDRVFVKGFAYGVTDPERAGRTLRYGEGNLAGKRALTVVTTGSPPGPPGPRGVNGRLDLVLFPLLHGTLWYSGMTVLPPLAVYGADHLSDQQFADYAASLRRQLVHLEHAEPLPYRTQNGGDYDDDLLLHDHLAPGADGLGIHYAGEVSPFAGAQAGCRPLSSSA